MAQGLITNTYLENIANAIRYKSGSVASYTPANMADAINSIPTGGGANLGPKTITANGIYDSATDGLDGYNSVTVAVPSSPFRMTYGSTPIYYVWNEPVEIDPSITDYTWMFQQLAYFNRPVNIPNGVTRCREMFVSSGFNQPIVIPETVDNALFMFYNSKFNQDITLPYTLGTFWGGLQNDKSFGKNVYFDSPTITHNNMFTDCNNSLQKNIFANLSSFVYQGTGAIVGGVSLTWESITNGYRNTAYNIYLYNNYLGMLTDQSYYQRFQGNTSFNLAIKTANTVQNMAYMLENCYNFNNSVHINNSVTNCRSAMDYCTNFNQPIHIPASVTNARGMLWGCTNFNSPVTFDDAQYNIDLRGLLVDTAFNLPITLPEGTRNVSIMFQNSLFNQPIVIPDSVDAAEGLNYFLFNAHKFNSPITIGNKVVNCYQALDCPGSNGVFNQDIYFPYSVMDYRWALYGQTNFESNIYINNRFAVNGYLAGLIRHDAAGVTDKRKNIFCYNLASINGTAEGNSVTGKTISWTPMTNGYYNSQYNIYLYNNYLGKQGGASLATAFKDNATFNLPIDMEGSVTNCYQMVVNCLNFNSPIVVGENVTNCANMIYNCRNLNSPITIGENVISCSRMFEYCTNFNQPITIPSKVDNCFSMLQYAYSFNQPITIPDTVTNVAFMFNDCREFNHPIIIPSNVGNCQQLFYNTKMNSDVFVRDDNACLWYSFPSIFEANIYINHFNSFLDNEQLYGALYKKTNATNMAHIYANEPYSTFSVLVEDSTNYADFVTTRAETWAYDSTNDVVYSPTANISIHCNWNGSIPGYSHLNYYSKDGLTMLHSEEYWDGFNGKWSYGIDEWSDTPNGTPVTNIKNNITADKNIYYCGNVAYIEYTWSAQDSSPVNREWNFVTNQGQPVIASSIFYHGNQCWQMGTINVFVKDNGGSEVQLTNGTDYDVMWSGSNSGNANYILMGDFGNRLLDSIRLQFDQVYRVNCSMNIGYYE